jgi:hypothetical protein
VQSRVPTQAYADPLDRIWRTAAERIGLRVERTDGAYASTSGDGLLLLASREHLDPDDSLAQMIFHELCHSLVQGEGSFQERDWGLDNETAADSHREEACLRVQATLAARHGLRRFFAPTTDYRVFYDALPPDALCPRHDPTITLAVSAVRRAAKAPWAPHLQHALDATQRVAAATRQFAPTAGEADARGLHDLWAVIDEAPAPHPTGLPAAAGDERRTCGTCVWRHGRTGQCRQADGQRVKSAWPACERWESALDCLECGACCRAAYDCVVVSPRDPVRKKHPALVVVRGPYLEMQREGDRCAQLDGGPQPSAGDPRFLPYTCKIYDDRPKTCRDFQNAGEHCLTARRRVGLSL